MRRRWTINQLKNLSDKDLVLSLIDERMSDCTSVYAPLYTRLCETRSRIANSGEFLKTVAPKNPMTITGETRRLILWACKTAGTSDPEKVMAVIGEYLTINEYKLIRTFLKWTCKDWPNRKFGHGNIKMRFEQFIKNNQE